jgi:hypothetical protein
MEGWECEMYEILKIGTYVAVFSVLANLGCTAITDHPIGGGGASQLDSSGGAENGGASGSDNETDGGASPGPSIPTESVVAFVGPWQGEPAGESYARYMVIEEEQGFLCANDGRSQGSFSYTQSGSDLIMGSYGYGSGDTLHILEEGTRMERSTVDKGEASLSYYRKVTGVPTWCTDQIETMRKSL